MSKQANNENRIEQWIATLEKKASTLIAGADLDELSSKERLELAMRCLTSMQRFMMLSQQLEAETPTGSTSIMLAAIMRQMRGETEVEEADEKEEEV